MKLNYHKALLVVGLCCSWTTFSYGQGNTPMGLAGQTNVQSLGRLGGAGSTVVFENRYQGVKGSPYFWDVWAPGKVIVKSGNSDKNEVFANIKLKFDAYSNLLVAVIPQTKDTLQFGTAPIISFTLQHPIVGNSIDFRRIKEAQAIDPALSDAFFAVLTESTDIKTSLVKRVLKKKIDANFKGGYSAGQTYDEIVDESQYYIVHNGKMQRVKINRKSLLDVFPSQADKLKAYIVSNKLAMSSEADLIQVLQYFYTL
ncbi:hypothetical protein [Rufibacter immobilis]|nr:hypothetical protein [Rufibacter immobilis]